MADHNADVRPRPTSITEVPLSTVLHIGEPSRSGFEESLIRGINMDHRKYGRSGISFLDDGARGVFPATECGFPVPKRGQSLCEFLSSGDFTSFMSPLDKENNHFYIAEIIIQAFQRSKYLQNQWKSTDRPTSESEFETPASNKKRPRKKRKERKSLPLSSSDFSLKTTTSTGQEASLSSDKEDVESESSLESESSQIPLTAEGVALCLLRNFRKKPLPKASDLTWIVSQSECDQELIPLPDSWPVAPDEAPSQFRTRGNEHWAPPRKQIIFNKIFKDGSIKEAFKVQNERCAGCGMKMSPSSRLRMCHYFGKYFCSLCHQNKKSLIPSRIILKWDFTQCPVSNFALKLLESFYCDPVFDLYDFTRSVFTKSRTLARVTDLRGSLRSAAQYIRSCKNANKERLLRVAEHLYMDQFKYSLNDFVQARNGELLRMLLEAYQRCVNHVQSCELCHQQGFFCEFCRKSEVIYPFDTSRIIQCRACRACYHKECVKDGFICSKCERLRK